VLNLLDDRLRHSFARFSLGPLEREVMEIVWELDKCTVRDVVRRLPQPRAYTTVMTTLVRLFRKGILKRTNFDRKFLYSARVNRQELEDKFARQLLGELLALPASSRTRELVTLSLLKDLHRRNSKLFETAVKLARAKRTVHPSHIASFAQPN
jgi:predicted transcriptional regulator